MRKAWGRYKYVIKSRVSYRFMMHVAAQLHTSCMPVDSSNASFQELTISRYPCPQPASRGFSVDNLLILVDRSRRQKNDFAAVKPGSMATQIERIYMYI